MDLRTEAERSRVTCSGRPTVEDDRSKQARRLDVVVGTLDASLLDLRGSSVFVVLKVGELADGLPVEVVKATKSAFASHTGATRTMVVLSFRTLIRVRGTRLNGGRRSPSKLPSLEKMHLLRWLSDLGAN